MTPCPVCGFDWPDDCACPEAFARMEARREAMRVHLDRPASHVAWCNVRRHAGVADRWPCDCPAAREWRAFELPDTQEGKP